ncbi:MAG: 5-formyltetrahydrofolate cyclo-ligase [Rhodobacteraceae bacterium]|nr:5-formyltetrahydrofolate cyclo-ligase [Paracoccaceae bacterium]
MSISDMVHRKEIARNNARLRRKLAWSPEHEAQACDHLLQVLDRLGRDSMVACYLPIHTELSPLQVLERCATAGRPTCLPVVKGPRTALEFQTWKPGDILAAGAFDTLIPVIGREVVPEVLVVPLLAFDSACYRLGYGGGFYDRTLQQLRASGKATAIGLAFSEQQVDKLPQGPHDQRLDMVVTERGVQECR